MLQEAHTADGHCKNFILYMQSYDGQIKAVIVIPETSSLRYD